MPIGAGAIPAIIGAAGSIGGAAIGAFGSKNAAGQLIDAQGRVITQANQAVQSGQQAVQQATGQGQAGVSQAAGQGQAGVSDATGQANLALQQSLPDILARYAPYSQAGEQSLGDIQSLAGANGQLAQQFSFDPGDLQNDPGYQFTLQQGQDAIQRAAAAKGGLFSTGTLKSLAGYTTGSANQYFNDAYNRAANTFNVNRQGALARINTLQGLAGQGLQAASGGAGAIQNSTGQQAQNLYGSGQFNANLGQNAANLAAQLGQQGAQQYANLGIQGADIVGRALTGQGTAGAAGTVGQANAINSGIGGVTNSINSGIGGVTNSIQALLLNRQRNNQSAAVGVA